MISLFRHYLGRPATLFCLLPWALSACASPSVGNLIDFGDPQFQTAVAKPLSTPPADWGGIFRWVQIGDSHTAGDYLTGEIRRRLQYRYGDAGIGWITPGYVLNQRSDSVKLSNDPGWSVRRALSPRAPEPVVPFGGFLASGAELGAGLRVTFKNPSSRQLMRLSVLQPGSERSVTLEADGGSGTALVPAPAGNGWKMTTVLLDAGEERISLRPQGAGNGSGNLPAVGGLALERLAPGVVVDAIGVNGAQIDEFLGWDEEATAAAFAARPPNLVVLAYGTNESVAKNFDREAFYTKVTTAVRRLRRTTSAAILLMSPPDMRMGTGAQRARRVGCGQPPINLTQVNLVLTAVARQEKTLFWDWGRWVRAQGGYCGTISLAHMNPPLAQPDYVHLTADGYRSSGDSLVEDVLRLAGLNP